jgi:hypothetical protein
VTAAASVVVDTGEMVVITAATRQLGHGDDDHPRRTASG